jgi:hypothetical protein
MGTNIFLFLFFLLELMEGEVKTGRKIRKNISRPLKKVFLFSLDENFHQ